MIETENPRHSLPNGACYPLSDAHQMDLAVIDDIGRSLRCARALFIRPLDVLHSVSRGIKIQTNKGGRAFLLK